jgi:hypothetical protein
MDIFDATDEFMALRFIATSPSPAVKHMWIMLMTQHAWQPTMYGMKENN